MFPSLAPLPGDRCTISCSTAAKATGLEDLGTFTRTEDTAFGSAMETATTPPMSSPTPTLIPVGTLTVAATTTKGEREMRQACTYKKTESG